MSKSTYKDIIEKQGFYIATPRGVSMLPLIRPGIDTVKIVPKKGRCEKYDVVLYKRDNQSQYILHRIIKVLKNGYYLCGDNQVIKEKVVNENWIIGVMEGYYREEKYIPITDPEYIDYSKKIVKSRRKRFIKYLIKRIFRFKKNSH